MLKWKIPVDIYARERGNLAEYTARTVAADSRRRGRLSREQDRYDRFLYAKRPARLGRWFHGQSVKCRHCKELQLL